MTGESIGKFVTDNHELLAQLCTMSILGMKMGRDYFVGKKKDKEREEKEETATMEREALRSKVEENTKLTVHVLEATAKAQGKTVEDLIEESDMKFDNILSQVYMRETSGERLENVRKRPG